MTGKKAISSVPLRIPRRTSSFVSGWPSRNLAISSSSISATVSSSLARYSFACSRRSAGISISWYFAPIVSSSKVIAFILTRSIMPRNLSSAPIGIWMGSGFAPSFSRMVSTAWKKSAPTRSILLMKQMRGTLYLFPCRQTVSDWGCTPCTASNTAQAPSRTRRDRSTSMVKSTWPGVSMMFSRWSRQKAVVAAEVIVMPRSRSCSIQSMTAVPSWTSPILCVTPV